jgi:transposase-like protein
MICWALDRIGKTMQDQLTHAEAASKLAELAEENEMMRRELLALRAFHSYFADNCEKLFWTFGMAPVGLYNVASGARRLQKEATQDNPIPQPEPMWGR